MLELIRERQPTFKDPRFDKWADVFRLMRERDERTAEEIREMLEWIFKDPASAGRGSWPGWRAVILSPANLRDKWDKIASQRIGRTEDSDSLRDSGTLYVPGRRLDDGDM